MGLTFFVDHCVPLVVTEYLLGAGHRVHQLRDLMPHDATDDQVLAKAQALDAVLVSLNGDFADIVNYPPAHFGGIIGLQLKGQPRSLPGILNMLGDYLKEHGDREAYRGKLLLVEASRIRQRT